MQIGINPVKGAMLIEFGDQPGDVIEVLNIFEALQGKNFNGDRPSTQEFFVMLENQFANLLEGMSDIVFGGSVTVTEKPDATNG